MLEIYLKKIMKENFPNLVKEISIQFQEAQRVPNKMGAQRPTPRHIISKCQRLKVKTESALAGVAQWIEHWPANQGVTSLIPSQGTSLCWGPGPQWGAYERQPHIDVSLSLFLPPFPSLKINI